MDHLPLWIGPAGAAGEGVGQGTKQIIEFMARLGPDAYTKQYGWLDPDFLMTLYPATMDFIASRTEFTFWCLWSAPLLVSTEVRNMTAEKRAILLNSEAIAINQDGPTAGARVRNDTDGGQVWARSLVNGDKAAVLYNAGLASINVSVAWAEIGWPADARVAVRDIWQGADLGTAAGGFTASLARRDVAFLRLTLT